MAAAPHTNKLTRERTHAAESEGYGAAILRPTAIRVDETATAAVRDTGNTEAVAGTSVRADTMNQEANVDDDVDIEALLPTSLFVGADERGSGAATDNDEEDEAMREEALAWSASLRRDAAANPIPAPAGGAGGSATGGHVDASTSATDVVKVGYSVKWYEAHSNLQICTREVKYKPGDHHYPHSG